MSKKILAINPGSTSTKIAVYEDDKNIFIKSLRHSVEKINSFENVYSQYEFRKAAIINELEKANIDIKSFDAVVGRGGLLRPISSGTYLVNDSMIEDMKNPVRGEHASNLGCILANEIAQINHVPAFIVDPVAVDEMEEIARYTGMPEIKRQSLFHALNQKAVARKVSKDLNIPYEELNLVVCHLGGGISIGAHKKGKVIDVNNALDGDGPMSPERSGTVPLGPLYKMAFSGKYTLKEIKRKNYGNGGMVAYLGTNNGAEIDKRIQEGDEFAQFIQDVMSYQIAKSIGSYATVLYGDVDAIVLTGGLAYSKDIVKKITDRVQFISKVLVYPGEDEMEALALGAIRVLNHEETPKNY